VVNSKRHYIGEFFGENLWQYEVTDAPEYILSHFRGLWTGAGSDFYVMRKNDTELAVMYHELEYRGDPSMRKWTDYEELLIVPIEKSSEIRIGESNIYRVILVGADAIG
jgi:hypothetical protein